MADRLKNLPASARRDSPRAVYERRTVPRSLNLPLLLGSVAAIALLLTAAFFVRSWRQSRIADQFAERAEQLAADKQYGRAAFYHQQYLQLRPDDLDARLRLVDVFEAMAEDSFSDRARLARFLYETIGAIPDGESETTARLRSRLADLLLEGQDYGAALEQAVALRESGEQSHEAVAARVEALARHYQIQNDSTLSEAGRRDSYAERAAPDGADANGVDESPSFVSVLSRAVELNPGDPELARIAATLFRTYPLVFSASKIEANRRADEIIQQMVDSRPDDPTALLSRYAYNATFDNAAAAEEDLEAVLRVDPTNLAGNWAAAKAAIERGQNDPREYDAAEERLRVLAEAHPQFELGRIELANLLRMRGDQTGAIEAAQRAIEDLPSGSIEAPILLVDLLLQQKDAAGAQKALNHLSEAIAEEARLSKRAGSSRRQLTVAELRQRDVILNYFAGRLALLQGEQGRGVELLRSYTDSVSASGGGAARIADAHMLIGNALERMGRWDQAAAERLQAVKYLAAVKKEPNADVAKLEQAISDLRLQAAFDLLRTGRADEAQSLILDTKDQAPIDAAVLQLLVEAQRQVARPAADRDWNSFDRALTTVKLRAPPSVRVFRAEVARVSGANPGDSGLPTIEELIDSYSSKLSADPDFWRVVADAWVTSGDAQKIDAAIAGFAKATDDQFKSELFAVDTLIRAGDYKQASARLAVIAVPADAERAVELSHRRVFMAISEDQKDNALREAMESLQKFPEDRRLLQAASALAVMLGEDETAEKVERMIADSPAFDPVEVRYYRANRLVSQFDRLDSNQERELQSLVADIRLERPDWSPAYELAAQHALKVGRANEAIQFYRQALSLGVTRPDALLTFANLLSEAGRFEEARDVLLRLADTLSGRSPVEIEVRLAQTEIQLGKTGDAEKRARSLVESNPDAPGALVLLAKVLESDGRLDDAADLISKARASNTSNPLLWFEAVRLATERFDAESLRSLLNQIPPELGKSPVIKARLMARSYLILGDITAAREEFKKAIEASPNDLKLRLDYADLLLRAEPLAAKPVLEQILSLDRENEAARSKLALLLAMEGPSANWTRIEGLIGALGEVSEDDPIEKRRLKAILLVEKGVSVEQRRENATQSRRLLEGIVKSGRAEPIDRVLLSAALEREAKLNDAPSSYGAAVSELRTLVQNGEAGKPYRLAYVGLLIRSLDAVADDASVSRLRSQLLQDGRRVLKEMQDDVSEADAGVNLKARLGIAGLEARLLDAAGDTEAAVGHLNDFVNDEIKPADLDDSTRLEVVLMTGSAYSSVGAHERAEQWYREASRQSPATRNYVLQSLVRQGRASDAVTLVLQSADPSGLSVNEALVLCAVLSSSNPDDATYQRGWEPIQAVVEDHQENVPLLMSVAVLMTTREDQSLAAEYFRRVIDVDPKNVTAINNLATLLGEQAATRDEAIELVERALELASGDQQAQSMLLDTMGSIQLAQGDHDEAIGSLERAVARIDVDPRYYFHLAVAYLRADRIADASSAYRKAMDRRLGDAVLTAADREWLQELKNGIAAQTASAKTSNPAS